MEGGCKRHCTGRLQEPLPTSCSHEGVARQPPGQQVEAACFEVAEGVAPSKPCISGSRQSFDTRCLQDDSAAAMPPSKPRRLVRRGDRSPRPWSCACFQGEATRHPSQPFFFKMRMPIHLVPSGKLCCVASKLGDQPTQSLLQPQQLSKPTIASVVMAGCCNFAVVCSAHIATTDLVKCSNAQARLGSLDPWFL